MAARTKAVETFQKLLNDVATDWKDERNRIIGHVTLSPPISFDYGDEGFTDDWAVVGVYLSMIAKLNFVGNVIDLGSIAVDELKGVNKPSPVFIQVPRDLSSSFLRPRFGRGDVQTEPQNQLGPRQYYGHEERKRVQPHHRPPQHHPRLREDVFNRWPARCRRKCACSLGTRNPARSLRVGTLALRSLMALVELAVLSLARTSVTARL